MERNQQIAIFKSYKGKLLRFLFSALMILTALYTVAQVTPTVYDFGKVKLWNNPHANFRYTNNTGKRVLFLPVHYKRDLYLHIPEGYIQPGESVTIEAVFYTEVKGNFYITQELYVSGSNFPISITMKGRILTFHPDARTVCPPIEHKKNPVLTPAAATITVYDKSTGLVINGVDLLLMGSSSNYFIEHTKKLKLPLHDLPVGLYQLDISKNGYMPVQHVQYISAQTGDLVFYLEPIRSEIASITPIDEPVGDDRIVEIERVEETDQNAIERIRKMMDERFKDRRIIEKDVLVIKDISDSTAVVEVSPEPSEEFVDVSLEKDFDAAGKLNPVKYTSNNVVFLIDVSGSMKIDDKLESMKVSMKSLVEILRPQDRVTIVIYSTKARIVLTSTPGDQKDKINAVIDALVANGSSYGAEGLTMAYTFALENFIPKGNNQVILASDGLFNSPDVTEKDIFILANTHWQQGITTSVVGFGRKEKAKLFMKDLATEGGGNFIQIGDSQEAQSALVAEIMHNAQKR